MLAEGYIDINLLLENPFSEAIDNLEFEGLTFQTEGNFLVLVFSNLSDLSGILSLFDFVSEKINWLSENFFYTDFGVFMVGRAGSKELWFL